MAFFSKLKSVYHHMPHGTAERGLSGVVVDKGERWGGALLMGAAKGYYGPKFVWKGHGLDLWSGVGLTVGAALLNTFTHGRSELAPHFERLGDVGVMSALGSLGAHWGMNKSGVKVAMLPGGSKPALPGQSVVGEIPQARAGAYLSAEDIARAAGRRM